MQNFLLSARAVLPMFLMIAAGYVCRLLGVLSREDVPRFNRVAFRVFLPCLLFYNVYVSDLSSAVRPRLIVFGVLGVLAVAALAIVGVLRFVPQPDRRGVIAQGIFRSNYVIMGIPIAQALLGEGNLGPIAILIAIVVPLFNFLAVAVLESFRGGKVRPGTVLLEIAKNPLVVSSVLGILCLLLRLKLPSTVESTVSGLGAVATPLQLFLLGAFFRFDGLARYKKPLAVVTIIKLFITPAVMLLLARGLGFRGVEFVALIGVFASPTAVNSFTMVQQMDCGDAELAGDIVIATSAVSVFSFFLWIWLFKSMGVF